LAFACSWPEIPTLRLSRSPFCAEVLGGSVFVLTAPVDRGLMGLYNRIFCWLGNGWHAIRAKKFHVFVHDLAAIEARIVGAGFLPRTRQHRRPVWLLRVYERDTK
jgi:hypothetical protein